MILSTSFAPRLPFLPRLAETYLQGLSFIGQPKANGGNMINIVTTGKVMSLEELSEVKGRAWDDVDVSSTFFALLVLRTPRTRRWKAKMLT